MVSLIGMCSRSGFGLSLAIGGWARRQVRTRSLTPGKGADWDRWKTVVPGGWLASTWAFALPGSAVRIRAREGVCSALASLDLKLLGGVGGQGCDLRKHLIPGLAAALRAGALTADAVALEARKHDENADDAADDTATDHPTPLMGGDGAHGQGETPAVRSLTERRLRAHIPADTRPLPSVDKYDQLLPSRRDPPNEGAAP